MVLFIITIIHKTVCLANVKNHTFVNQMVLLTIWYYIYLCLFAAKVVDSTRKHTEIDRQTEKKT